MNKRGRERLIIRCDDCSTPIFELDGDCLIFRNKHWGKRHLTVVRIEELLQGSERTKARKEMSET